MTAEGRTQGNTARPVESEFLKGNTLRVYLQLLKHGSCEMREVQRALGLSSASLASYHLSRLVEAGYAEQSPDGKYRPSKDVSPVLFEGYSKIGVALVPQLFFFSLLLTLLVAIFSYETIVSTAFFPTLIVVSGTAVAVLWFETARLWRKLVTWE